jgi:hypothetical protein
MVETNADQLRPISVTPLAFARLRPPYDTLLGAPPAEVMAVPSMMSERERRFLYNLAREHYVGEGVILDAGAFLGASTVCFGAALRGNPRLPKITAAFPKPVRSFELAHVHKNMLTSLPRHGVTDELEVGDSFAPYLQRNVAPWADLVDLRIGDIMAEGKIDAPIEILFLDVLKQEKISEFAVAEYFPRLIAGRSILIQQDYFFDGLPFIRVHQELFEDAFEFLGEIGSSAIYRCVRPITAEDVAAKFQAMRDPAVQMRAIHVARARTADRLRQLMIEVSIVRLATTLSGPAAGRAEMARIEGEYAAEIASPTLPARLRKTLLSARYLSHSSGDRKSQVTATQIAFGYVEPTETFEQAFAGVLARA